MKSFNKIRVSVLLTFLTSLTLPLLLSAQEMEIFGKEVEVKGIFYSRVNFDYKRDNFMEDFIEWRNKFFLELKIPFKNGSLVFSGKSFYNLLWNEKEEDSDFFFDVYEAYVKFSKGEFDFSLGKQFLSWGKSDVSVLNIATPFDYREFIFMEEEFFNKPILLGKISWIRENWTLEGVFIPFYEPPDFNIIKDDWSIFIPELLTENGDYESIKAIENQITPVYFDYPDRDIRNGEAGVHFSSSVSMLDYSFVLFYGWTDIPAFYFHEDFLKSLEMTKGSPEEKLASITPVEVITYSTPDGDEKTRDHFITASPVRSLTTGGSFSTAWKGIGFMGDLGISYPSIFYNENFRVRKKSLISISTNIDYIFPEDIYGNLLFSGFFIPDYSEKLFIVKQFNPVLGFYLRKSILEDKLTMEGRFVLDINYLSWALDIRTSYSLKDNFKIIAGTHILDGRRASLFGFFRENDEGFLGIKWTF